ncbi:MAG: hypothetical protein ACKOZM_08165 [Flavobacteriales bacterium]
MKSIGTIVLLLTATIGWTQKTEPTIYIKLFAGDSIAGSRLTYLTPDNTEAMFQMAGKLYPAREVEFFRNNFGYFANVGSIEGFKNPRFAMRLGKGKINLFQRVQIETYMQDSLILMDEGMADYRSFQYYNVGNEALRKAIYSNMKVDLAGSAAAAPHLKDFRKYRAIQIGLIACGAGVLGLGAYSSALPMSGVENTKQTVLNPVTLLGLILSGGSLLMEAPKRDALWLAADAHNQQ